MVGLSEPLKISFWSLLDLQEGMGWGNCITVQKTVMANCYQSHLTTNQKKHGCSYPTAIEKFIGKFRWFIIALDMTQPILRWILMGEVSQIKPDGLTLRYWLMREVLERSEAVKCPNALTHLVGVKKVNTTSRNLNFVFCRRFSHCGTIRTI